eukprot:TRINITY_DN102676_c0_g1_i1.p1 TRINITY_DN102676_c0_g1~~TRINITY_DN102676_c0_g1_i1.p1  ORF type:complete len:241 (+),score=57.11 TRINITY_DN102676_c0_g1_i1:33-725(+)
MVLRHRTIWPGLQALGCCAAFLCLCEAAQTRLDVPRRLIAQDDAHSGRLPGDASPSCLRFLGGWAQRGGMDMAVVCRQAYSEAACEDAERALGGAWPEAAVAASGVEQSAASAASAAPAASSLLDAQTSAEAIAATACAAIAQNKARRRSVMLGQLDRFNSSDVQLPQWAQDAPVMFEDPEVTDLPGNHGWQPSTWDGPKLVPGSQVNPTLPKVNASTVQAPPAAANNSA